MSFVIPTLSQQQRLAASAKKRKLNTEAGVSAEIGGNKVALSQFIPGRGAELSWTKQNILPAIKFKTGELVGPACVDAYTADRKFYQGQKLSMGFAFKAILDADFVINQARVPTRFYVHNVFRHTRAEACGWEYPCLFDQSTTLWNETLGPDGSRVRVSGYGGGGSAYPPANAVAAGYDDRLVSPFRYPLNGGTLFSRLTRQNLENFMWNSNPMKIPYVQPQVNGAMGTITTTPLAVCDNATADPTGDVAKSHPWQLQSTTATYDTPITPSNNTGYYYRCQAKNGHIAYHFNNDGTSPLIVDVVITRIKKGHEVCLGNGLLDQAYANGYINYTLANRGQGDYGGQPPVGLDCLDNARVPFMPAKALQYAPPNSAEEPRPYKQVARDQFMISGGGTRPWSMDLQSLNYRANDYSQVPMNYNSETKEILGDTKNADDLTYVVSIAFSSLAVPLGEFPNSQTVAIVDRVAQSVNCSVTGVYTENVEPVYLASNVPKPYINGTLDYVYYADSTPEPDALPILAGIDIANAGNVVRSQTQGSAFINVGPTNTQPGA